MALGSAEITPIEQTSAFSVFPNDGVRVAPRYITKVTEVEVKIIGIDGNDRIKLSHRALLPPPEGFNAEAADAEGERPRRPHGDRPGGPGRPGAGPCPPR